MDTIEKQLRSFKLSEDGEDAESDPVADSKALCVTGPRPCLPAKRDATNAFHTYKDQLTNKPRSALPAEITVTGPDVTVLLAVLRNHPRAAAKIGDGIARLFVRRNIVDGQDVCCCYVERVDGSEEDFSILKPYKTKSWKDDVDTSTPPRAASSVALATSGNEVVPLPLAPRAGIESSTGDPLREQE
eukprot:CAMPEP_0197294338 /NCGR_PEP_ID=MMETSP0890-20130614/32144_1 /TAXON_ID=44058 ORGANISM="Aureoumbra lagunensis, Strain CCMP1510" /NCGR_SAMPLE_ID=MMETSP0890 /ASSEMBLY_ACC=CAM_ASM_000533 /LENGTH=186 /DNA_ID=CAMNT_0042769705 /DNA_START=142 /DNA_END=703 /DNA_ORIENTATION=-